jgi:hypothetical protein
MSRRRAQDLAPRYHSRDNRVWYLYAYVRPDGLLDSVIDAPDLDSAWVIATGWGDRQDREYQQSRGWRLVPCVVEWE